LYRRNTAGISTDAPTPREEKKNVETLANQKLLLASWLEKAMVEVLGFGKTKCAQGRYQLPYLLAHTLLDRSQRTCDPIAVLSGIRVLTVVTIHRVATLKVEWLSSGIDSIAGCFTDPAARPNK
jgi:hypothetical protein